MLSRTPLRHLKRNVCRKRNTISKSDANTPFVRNFSLPKQDHRKFLDFAEQKLNITDKKDWYSKSKKVFL